jgi:hypothetical protein
LADPEAECPPVQAPVNETDIPDPGGRGMEQGARQVVLTAPVTVKVTAWPIVSVADRCRVADPPHHPPPEVPQETEPETATTSVGGQAIHVQF